MKFNGTTDPEQVRYKIGTRQRRKAGVKRHIPSHANRAHPTLAEDCTVDQPLIGALHICYGGAAENYGSCIIFTLRKMTTKYHIANE